METKTEVNLAPFCAFGAPGRYDMTSPYIFEGWLYATDGRIVVRVPREARNDDMKNRPDCAGIFKGFEPESCNERWDELPQSNADQECPQCDGEGHVPDEDNEDSRCQMCAGLGHLVMARRRRVNGVPFANLYDRLIMSLPGPVLYSSSDKALKNHLLRFVFDGGQGALMGMSDMEAPHAK